MKVSIRILTTSLIISLFALSARAFVVFQDNFNYPVGALTNSTWVGGAGNSLPNSISVTSTNSITIGYNGTTSSQPRAYFTNGLSSFIVTNGIWIGGKTNLLNNGTNAYFFPSNAPVAALYYSFTITMAGSGLSGTYFAYICDTNFDYGARLFSTNGPGQTGYQLAIQNSGSFMTTNLSGALLVNPTVLNANQPYQVVVRYILSSGLATMWINPVSESAPVNANSTTANSVTCTGPSFTGGGNPGTSYAAIGFRNTSGLGQITIGNLIVGTAFADCVPSSAGLNPPFIASQPLDDPSGYIGAPAAAFTTVVGGDPLTYQHWFFDTNTTLSDQSGIGAIIGSVSNVLTLTNLTSGQAGTYDCIVSNAAGTNVTRYALLTVYTSPAAPVISAQPVGSTNTVGDSVTFSVSATGVPPPAYQWFVINSNSVPPTTNLVVTTTNILPSVISGTNAATLTITQVTTNSAGYYFVVITNSVGVTNSAIVHLAVNQPLFTSIATLHTMVNGSFMPTNPVTLFTIQGIVTTWTNLTTAGNCEFFVQDSSGGICTFWQGAAASTNLPPGGALVKITAPITNFDGLLEIQPVFGNKQESVTIISTNNPLPTAQALPSDPNIVNNTAQMFAMEGTYFVASNVTLSSAPDFVASVNEPLSENASNVLTDPIFGITFTNEVGETADLYVNSYTSIPNTTQPSGPVTIYGVLSYYKSGGLVVPAGFEFTPTRLQDIITYTRLTNVLSNLTRQGDLPTNSFPQNVLRTGDTLTSYLSISDPEGGNVTLNPSYVGLPSDASWSNVSAPGQNATAVFHFSPRAADDGSNYVVAINVSSTSGNNFTNTFTVYVPTPQEQQIYISEIFANPTTNTASPAYNPLKRGSGDFGVETNIPLVDEYIEIANVSSSTLQLGAWYVGNSTTLLDQLGLGNSSGEILSGDAYVVYDGPPNGDPSNPTILNGYPNDGSGYIEPIGTGESLGLSTNGGIVTLYNANTDLVDRVVYPASALNTSFSRFPTLNSGMVPQQYISTNYTTAGLQYDGGSWSAPTKVPVGVANVKISLQGTTNAIFAFPVSTHQAYTIWNSGSLYGPWNVLYGQGPLTLPSATLTNATSGPLQYYFMTTQ